MEYADSCSYRISGFWYQMSRAKPSKNLPRGRKIPAHLPGGAVQVLIGKYRTTRISIADSLNNTEDFHDTSLLLTTEKGLLESLAQCVSEERFPSPVSLSRSFDGSYFSSSSDFSASSSGSSRVS